VDVGDTQERVHNNAAGAVSKDDEQPVVLAEAPVLCTDKCLLKMAIPWWTDKRIDDMENRTECGCLINGTALGVGSLHSHAFLLPVNDGEENHAEMLACQKCWFA
jgi:hypothetical protein